MLYLQECEINIRLDKVPGTYSQAMKGEDSDKWIDAMFEEMKSMATNKVWDLVDLPEGHKTIGCKWVYKTKHDSLVKSNDIKLDL